MKLGISSLSHIISVGHQFQDNDIHKLLIEATKSCLEFSESHQLEVCELVIDPATTLELENKQDFVNICKDFSIQKQVHAALIDVSLCSNNQEISNATLNTFKNNLDIAKEIEAKTITIHPGVSNIPISVLRVNNLSRLVQQLKNLLEYSKESSVKICLENMDPNAGLCRDEKELLLLYQKISNPDLWFTYDSSHLRMNSANFTNFIEKMHPHIGNVHIADNLDKKHDQHPTIGTGKVQFPEILDALRKYDYSESLIIEILDTNGLEKSIDFMRTIL